MICNTKMNRNERSQTIFIAAQNNYEHQNFIGTHIIECFERYKFSPLRFSRRENTDGLTKEIIHSIHTSSGLIAIELAPNKNVAAEIGIAIGAQKKCCIITADATRYFFSNDVLELILPRSEREITEFLDRFAKEILA